MRLTFCLLGFKLSLCPVESFLCPRLDFLFGASNDVQSRFAASQILSIGTINALF